MTSKILQTTPSRSILLIRIAVGCIFLSEGIQKFLYADALGSGRFEKIGIPAHAFFGPFVGTLEIVCGLLVLVGLYVRIAVVPLIVIMIVALFMTKIIELPQKGFWDAAHGARTDFAMLLSTVFLLLVGAGRWSFDFRAQQPHTINKP